MTREINLPYLLYAPSERKIAGSPLLLFLHGAGEKGDDVQQVRSAVLPRLLGQGLELPLTVVCPQCPGELPGWPMDDLHVFLEALLEKYSLDRRRLYLTGISMGGRGTWEFAYAHADRLAAIVPICGPSLPTLAPRLASLPAWIFHGAEDDVVPVARSEEMFSALQAVEAPCLYSRLEGQGHSCGEAVYTSAELMEWLFQQIRK